MCHRCPEGFFRGWFNQENAHLLLPLAEHISPFFLKQCCMVEGTPSIPDKRLQKRLWISDCDHELGNLFD